MSKLKTFQKRLARIVSKKINEQYRSQKEAAYYLETTQQIVSAVNTGKVVDICSIPKMITMLHAMGYKVEINLVKI